MARGQAEGFASLRGKTARRSGQDINTTYFEHLYAIFRASLAAASRLRRLEPLVRRGWTLLLEEAALTAGMYPVGWANNFVWYHESLRLAVLRGAGHNCQERTPVIIAGWSEHCRTMFELLSYQVALLPWGAPRRRVRPPKRANTLAMAAAS
ncbi:MAG: hypothetical protein EPO21_13505 [Chloroflexota bacterium]|nr:MAG: hypothetical protein EPO21_13505 [Chloroflexota bacterium]